MTAEDNYIFSDLSPNFLEDDEDIFHLKVLNTLRREMENIDPQLFSYNGLPNQFECGDRFIDTAIGNPGRALWISVDFCIEEEVALSLEHVKDCIDSRILIFVKKESGQEAEKVIKWFADKIIRFIEDDSYDFITWE